MNGVQDPEELDLENLLRKVIRRHTEGVMKFFQAQLQRGMSTRGIFSRPGEVTLVSNGEYIFARRLCWKLLCVVLMGSGRRRTFVAGASVHGRGRDCDCGPPNRTTDTSGQRGPRCGWAGAPVRGDHAATARRAVHASASACAPAERGESK